MIERGRMPELVRCPRKDCREPMVFEGFDGIGNLVFKCEPCGRNRKGKCRRCPTGRLKPNPRGGFGRSKFCPRCRKRVDHERDVARRPESYKRNKKWRALPGVQAELNRLERERRRLNPPDDFDRAAARVRRAVLLRDPVKRQEYRERNRRTYHRSAKNAEWVAKRRTRKKVVDHQRWLRKKEQKKQLLAV